jgi:hypothetical protein
MTIFRLTSKGVVPGRLISILFEAKYTGNTITFPYDWTGKNATLAMSLLRPGDQNVRLRWPIRMSIFSLKKVSVQVGEIRYKPGVYSPNHKDGSLYIPSHQTVWITDIDKGALIKGEMLLEPLVVELDRRKGVLVTEVPNQIKPAPLKFVAR